MFFSFFFFSHLEKDVLSSSELQAKSIIYNVVQKKAGMLIRSLSGPEGTNSFNPDI